MAEVRVKTEPGLERADVSGSVGNSSVTTRSAGPDQGEVRIKQESKVSVKSEVEDRVQRALSFNSDKSKTEDDYSPKGRRLSAPKEPGSVGKKPKAKSKSKKGSPTGTGPGSVTGSTTTVEDSPEKGRMTAVRADPAAPKWFGNEGLYRPKLASSYAVLSGQGVVHHAGILVHEIRSNPVLIPLEIPPPPTIWGPIVRPEFDRIPNGDRNVAMRTLVHMLLCAGMQVKQRGLPVLEGGEAFYMAFPLEDIRSTGMRLFQTLSALVGAYPMCPTFQSQSDPARPSTVAEDLTERFGRMSTGTPNLSS